MAEGQAFSLSHDNDLLWQARLLKTGRIDNVTTGLLKNCDLFPFRYTGIRVGLISILLTPDDVVKLCTAARGRQIRTVWRMSKIQRQSGMVSQSLAGFAGGAKVIEPKKIAENAHVQVKNHCERYRHLTGVYTTEKNLSEGLGRKGELIRDTAGATHPLSCGTTAVTATLESLHRGDTRRGGPEITLVERRRRRTCDVGPFPWSASFLVGLQ